MDAESELVAVANENLVASFRKLSEHVQGGAAREADGVFTFATGLPMSLFNGCVVTEEGADLESALAWLTDRGVPFRAWIPESLVRTVVEALRTSALRPEPYSLPGMVLRPVPEPPATPPAVTVDSVGRDLDEFRRVVVEGGADEEDVRRLFTASFAADPDVRMFVGRLDGHPVGTSVAVRSARAGGVVAVGTLPTARRRGVGTALSWAAARAAVDWGLDTAVLQSTAMGHPAVRVDGIPDGGAVRRLRQHAVSPRARAQCDASAVTPVPIGHETPVPPSPQ